MERAVRRQSLVPWVRSLDRAYGVEAFPFAPKGSLVETCPDKLSPRHILLSARCPLTCRLVELVGGVQRKKVAGPRVERQLVETCPDKLSPRRDRAPALRPLTCRLVVLVGEVQRETLAGARPC